MKRTIARRRTHGTIVAEVIIPTDVIDVDWSRGVHRRTVTCHVIRLRHSGLLRLEREDGYASRGIWPSERALEMDLEDMEDILDPENWLQICP